jgi:hypothetical protein
MDLWERVFDVEPESTRRGMLLSRLHLELAMGIIKARRVLPTRLNRVVEEGSDLLQGELCALLALPAEIVRREPYETRRRFGGGEYHLFSVRVCVWMSCRHRRVVCVFGLVPAQTCRVRVWIGAGTNLQTLLCMDWCVWGRKVATCACVLSLPTPLGAPPENTRRQWRVHTYRWDVT